MTSVGITRPTGSGTGPVTAPLPGWLRAQIENRRLAVECEEAILELQRIRAVNRTLKGELQASLLELHDSRARLMSAAVQERHRIERDLHDGAQQRLVAAQVRVGLARELMKEDPRSGQDLLDAISSDIQDALDDLRALAHGIYPAILSDRGIAAALREAARHSTLEVTVDPGGAGRYSPEIESAVYFCCLESLQNAAKHAHGATRVSIALSGGAALGFEVSDDGAGDFPSHGGLREGAGLTNMRDRLAAVGGRLEVRTRAGGGTTAAGSIPLHS